jgi:anti-sigma28 factor (negative regulator of flagellin synthesis)
MKIDERKALNTQKPQSEKVYETKANVSSRTAKNSSPALQDDGVALNSQDQLRALAMTPSAEDTSRVARLTQLVQSGQYQVDPVALSGAMVAAMLKGY